MSSSSPFNSNGLSGHLAILQYQEELSRLKREATELSNQMEGLITKTNSTPGMDVLHKIGKHSSTSVRKHKNAELPSKEFHMQNSVLTDILRSKHIQTIQNMTIAVASVWVFATTTTDVLDTGSVTAIFPKFDLLKHAFRNYEVALVSWILMFIHSLMIYPLCFTWSQNKLLHSRTWRDRLFYATYALGQVYFLWLPSKLFLEAALGPACLVAISMEQMRLIMKTHSFFREILRRRFRWEDALLKKTDGDSKQNDEDVSFSLPNFSRYLYFLFAPTLVYQDAYPRNEHVNWHFVCTNFFQFFACMTFKYFLLQRYIVPEFNLCADGFSLDEFIRAIFRLSTPGILVLMLLFFSFLHSWLNAWAEMLRFGDRMFYKDWWNCTTYAAYYRSWNCVVHDWLYVYIYKELLESFSIRTKTIAAMFVFALSASFHEYIVSSAMGFFCPALLFEFGLVGFIFLFVKFPRKLSNIIVWATLCLGMGVMLALYCLEISARLHCPPIYSDLRDTFFPRFFACPYWNEQ